MSARAEEGVIRLLSLDPELGKQPGMPPPEDFSSEALGHIYAVLLERIRRHLSVSSANLGEELSAPEMSLLVRIQQAPVSLQQGRRALEDYINCIREHKEQRDQKNAPLDLLALAERQREKGKRYTENG